MLDCVSLEMRMAARWRSKRPLALWCRGCNTSQSAPAGGDEWAGATIKAAISTFLVRCLHLSASIIRMVTSLVHRWQADQFNPPSSRARALQNFLVLALSRWQIRQTKVDEACIRNQRHRHPQHNDLLAEEYGNFIKLLTLQKWLGQLSEGSNSWFNSIGDDGCIHPPVLSQRKRASSPWSQPRAGRGAPWARRCCTTPRLMMVGADEVSNSGVWVITSPLWW